MVAQQSIKAFGQKHRARAIRIFSLNADDIEVISPCTALQEGMILGSLSRGRDGLYFNTFTFDLGKKVHVQNLRQAWQRVSIGSQILRTRFLQTGDGYAQVTFRNHRLPFDVMANSKHQQLSQFVHETRLKWIAANNIQYHRPIEIIIWRNGEEAIMVVNIFHALYDGNCLDRMLAAVFNAYQGQEDLDLGPPFHDALASGPLLPMDGARSFWKCQIRPLAAIEFRSEGSPSQVLRSIKEAKGLDTCRKKLNVTHQAVVQATWMATLALICCTANVSTGLVSSGRAIDFEDADKVFGPMFNTLPYQLRVDASETWATLIRRCHDFNVESLPFQHTALRDINKWCHQGPTSRLFHTLFVFQFEQKSSHSGFQNELWKLRGGDGAAEYPLAVEAEYQLDGSLSATLASTGQFINDMSLETIADQFQACLEAAINSPETTLITTVSDFGDLVDKPDSAEEDSFLPANGQVASNFTWSSAAIGIREEVSRLALVKEDDVTEGVSIFELGLDSIDAIKLSSRLAERGLRLPVSAIMQTATIANMVHRVDQHIPDPRQADASFQESVAMLNRYLGDEGLFAEDIERVLPPTPLQEAMIFGMVDSGYQQYFNHDVLRLRPEVDQVKLRDAWQLVFETSAILRTSFIPVDDPQISYAYAQIETKSSLLPWNSIKSNDADHLHEVIAHVRNNARDCVARTASLQLTFVEAPGERFLVLSLPHALYDGYSLNLIHNDVQNAYHTGELKKRPVVDSLLQEIVSASKSSAAERFWSDYLCDAKPCSIQNTAFVKSSSQIHSVHRQETRSAILETDLRAFCKGQSITLQAFGQSCFALVLASYAHRLDPVFGVVLSGRDSEIAQRVLFPTMNTVAFKCLLEGTKSAFLRSSQETMAAIRAHQYFPLARAQRFAKTDGQKLFDSLFIYQANIGMVEAGEALYDSVDASSDLEVPVCAEMEILDGSIVWRVACHTEVFGTTDTENLLRRLEQAAEHLLVAPDSEVVALDDGVVVIGDLASFTLEQSPSMLMDGHRIAKENLLQNVLLSPEAKIVRSILARVSQTPESKIGQQTNLYHIGLDSISAIKVCSLLKKKGIAISVSNLLRASTLQSIVDSAKEVQGVDAGNETLAATYTLLTRVKEISRRYKDVQVITSDTHMEAILPATAGQIYMLRLWEQSRGRLFFDTFYFTVQSSDISPQTIEQSTTTWIKTRPNLRTVFMATLDPSLPLLQLVIRADRVNVCRVEFVFAARTNNIVEDDGTIQASIDCSTRSDIDRLLPSVSYQRQGRDTWKIGVRIHHALYDGISLPILLAELEHSMLNHKTTLKPRGAEDFSIFAASSYVPANVDDARGFWTTYLTRVQPRVRPRFNGHDVYRQRFAKYQPGFVPHAQKLLDLARENGVSLPSLFLAICAQSFNDIRRSAMKEPKASGELPTEVVIGVYIANRGQQTEKLDVFPTLNLLPLVVDTSMPTIQSASRIQNDLRDISEMPNVGVGLWQIQEWTGVHVPIFVNWIQVPGQADNNVGESADKFRAQGELNREIDDTVDDFKVPEDLLSEQLSESYMVSPSALNEAVFWKGLLSRSRRISMLK
jgi:aryl carrier-like protein